MIESRNLFKLQSRLTKDKKSIPVKTLEKDYILSWLLIGIAKSDLYKIVAFKGGTALKKFYFSEYRFSEDLDFTLLKPINIEDLKEMLKSVCLLVIDEANIKLAIQSYEIRKNTYTFYINFSGPLGAELTRGEIKLDFTIKELIITKLINGSILKSYDEYNDLPNNIKLNVYSLEEIFMEKYLSILSKFRTEPRDIYDLWYLVTNKRLEYDFLLVDIKKKGSAKDIDSFDIIKNLSKKENNYKNLWETRLSKHMIDLPNFDSVYRELKRVLRSIKEN